MTTYTPDHLRRTVTHKTAGTLQLRFAPRDPRLDEAEPKTDEKGGEG